MSRERVTPDVMRQLPPEYLQKLISRSERTIAQFETRVRNERRYLEDLRKTKESKESSEDQSS